MTGSSSSFTASIGEWLSITLRILLMLSVIGLAAGIATWISIDPAIHDRSPVGLANKLAEQLGLSTAEQPLLAAPAQYADNDQLLPGSTPYPRILLTQLRGWNGQQPAPPLVERVKRQRHYRERLQIDCASDHALQHLLCQFLSPDPTTKSKAENALKRFTPRFPNIDGNYGNGWVLALAYDLARAIPGFSTAILSTAEQQILTLLEKHLDILDGKSASLWHGRSTLAASAFTLAAVLESEPPRNKALIGRAAGHFQDVIAALEATETWPEGYNYWLQERGLPIALGLVAVKHTTTDAEQARRVTTLMRRIGLWHIYLTRPDNKIEGWGDEGSRVDLKEGTRRIIDILAQATGDAVLGRYSLYLRQLHRNDSYYRWRQWQIPLFNDPFVSDLAPGQVKDLTDVMGDGPAAELFGPGYSNHLIIRSGWSPKDTFITFRASDIFTHHQHYDAGHFTLFKGAPLAVNSSTYGSFFSPHRLNYAIRTIAKNSLLIFDPDERVQPNRFFKRSVNAGGQRIVIPTGSAIASFPEWQLNRYSGTHLGAAELQDYASQPGVATYIRADITRAYNGIHYASEGSQGKVKRVVRELIYLYEADCLIIRDRVFTTNPLFQVRWLLHTYNPFTSDRHRVIKGSLDDGILETPLSASLLTTSHQGATLGLRVFEPAVEHITQIGGPGHRYFVPPPDNRSRGHNFTEGSLNKPWFEQPLWRAEIPGVANGTEHRFLIALFPDINGKQPPQAHQTIKKQDTEGLRIGGTRLWFGYCPKETNITVSEKPPTACQQLSDKLCVCGPEKTDSKARG